MLLILMLVIGLAVTFGVWRRFTAIQWIWLMAGAALLLIVAWAFLLFFVIGPEMQRMGPPGTQRGF
jgi:hypothetical protein